MVNYFVNQVTARDQHGDSESLESYLVKAFKVYKDKDYIHMPYIPM